MPRHLQCLDPPKLREQLHPEQGYDDGAHAAHQHRRERAEQGGHGARAEFAERARGADEHEVHRQDPAEHLVRRPRLHQRMADHDADGVAVP